jgi:hypothetical protein
MRAKQMPACIEFISIARGATVRQVDLDLIRILSLRLEETMDERVRNREKTRKALESGAVIEPGTFTARMAWDDIMEDQNKLVIECLPSVGD